MMRITQRGLFLLLSSAPLGMALLASPTPAQPRLNPQASAPEPPVSYLWQGWSPEIRQAFHYVSQGSELIPYYWFLNLMEPDGVTPLKDDMKTYGMLYDNVTPDPKGLNPDGLPIGFVQQKESQKLGGIAEKHWLGLTCAACHTGALIPKDGSNALKQGMIIIDGAPSSMNMGGFFLKLRDSVLATNNDPSRLSALAKKVLAKGDGTSIADIEARFNQYTQQMKQIFPLYIPKSPCGPGRLDCFGAIFNRVTVYDIKSNQTPPAKLDAPVNYPFIWYTNRQDHIQWFGGLPNSNWLDRLARNAGEVCGVFGQVVVNPKLGLSGYPSSLNATGLGRIDTYVNNLTAPKWSDVFPAPDRDAVNRGRVVFMQTCQTGGCHQDLAAKGQVDKVSPTPLLPDLNTDENNTKLVHQSPSRTGILQGAPALVVFGPPLNAPVQADQILGNLVAGTLLGQKEAVIAAYVESLFHSADEGKSSQVKVSHAKIAAATLKVRSMVSAQVLSASATAVSSKPQSAPTPGQFNPMTDGYEARSLNGIWATAPYLHNGSVPNLYELLWPEFREQTFYVGSRVYDPERAGFISDGSAGGVLFDTRVSGNSNKGHTYGSSLDIGQKEDLLAYLKQL